MEDVWEIRGEKAGETRLKPYIFTVSLRRISGAARILEFGDSCVNEPGGPILLKTHENPISAAA